VWMFVCMCVCLCLYVYGRRRERASMRKIRCCFKHIDRCIDTHNTHMHVFAGVKFKVLSLLMSTNTAPSLVVMPIPPWNSGRPYLLNAS